MRSNVNLKTDANTVLEIRVELKNKTKFNYKFKCKLILLFKFDRIECAKSQIDKSESRFKIRNRLILNRLLAHQDEWRIRFRCGILNKGGLMNVYGEFCTELITLRRTLTRNLG